MIFKILRHFMVLPILFIFNIHASSDWKHYTFYISEHENSSELIEVSILHGIFNFENRLIQHREIHYANYRKCPNRFDDQGKELFHPHECSYIFGNQYLNMDHMGYYKDKQNAIANIKDFGEFTAFFILTGGLGSIIKTGIKKAIKYQLKNTYVKTAVSSAGTVSQFATTRVASLILDPLGAENNRAIADQYNFLDASNWNTSSFEDYKVDDLNNTFELVKKSYHEVDKIYGWEWVQCGLELTCMQMGENAIDRLVGEHGGAVNFLMNNGMAPW